MSYLDHINFDYLDDLDPPLPQYDKGDDVVTPLGEGYIAWVGESRHKDIAGYGAPRYGVRIAGYNDLQFFGEDELRIKRGRTQ